VGRYEGPRIGGRAITVLTETAEWLRGELLPGGELAAAGVGDENIDASVLLRDGLVQSVEISQVGDDRRPVVKLSHDLVLHIKEEMDQSTRSEDATAHAVQLRTNDPRVSERERNYGPDEYQVL
jgi:hypothetical protein